MQDVVHMPALRQLYRAKLCDVWWRKIEVETIARVALSQGRSFNGQGLHMAKAPASWEHFRPSWKERQSRTLMTIRRRDLAASPPVVLTEASSAQSRSAAEPDSDLLVTLGALSMQGAQSGLGRSRRDESHLRDEGDEDATTTTPKISPRATRNVGIAEHATIE